MRKLATTKELEESLTSLEMWFVNHSETHPSWVINRQQYLDLKADLELSKNELITT